MSIKYFTIYGERCSGTNFLEELITNNFNIEITWDYGHKHFFGFKEFQNDEKENQTLFVGIVRNPIDWLYSFFTNPHHVPPVNRTLKNFFFNKFYSISDVTGKRLDPDTEPTFKNIFVMRRIKNDYLYNIMKTKVKNYTFIKYEDLATDPDKFLMDIKNKYNLTFKHDKIVKIDYYKKEKNQKFQPKQHKFNAYTLATITYNLDKEQEKLLGYNI